MSTKTLAVVGTEKPARTKPFEMATISPLATNPLGTLKCPSCNQNEKFEIAATIRVKVNKNGLSKLSDPTWSNQAECNCPVCGYESVVSDFDETNPIWGHEQASQMVVMAAREFMAMVEAQGKDKAMKWAKKNLKPAVAAYEYYEEMKSED